MRSMDWSTTPVGPMEGWPLSLRVMVQTILCSRNAMFLWWGEELVQFYNDAYLPSFGEGKHPAAMGQRGVDCWGEIWPIIGPQIEGVMSSGTTTLHEDAPVPIFRNGRIEEVFWSYGYSPVFDDDGRIAGTLVVCTETTAGVLANRRLKLLARVVEQAALAERPGDLLPRVFDCLSELASDVPFAAAFGSGGELLHCYGLDEAGKQQLVSWARRSGRLTEPTHHALHGPVVAGPWPEPVTHAFAMHHEDGMVVLGTSPRLPFDDAYRNFLIQLVESTESARACIEAINRRIGVERERRDLLMQAPVGAAILMGPEHTFELANARYVAMVGREVIGKAYLEAFPELVGTPVIDELRRVYEEGVPYATEELAVALQRENGAVEDSFFKFNLEPIRNNGGEVTGMMAIAVDITESVRARKEQARAFAERDALVGELENANRTKDEFLAMLSHELRNPLSPIVTALELMKEGDISSFSREHAIIERQAKHLVRLVDDLLDVARIVRGKVELKKSECEIGQVVANAIEMAESLLEKRRHHLIVEVDGPIAWWGDSTRLSQVIANLLTNAARYTDPAGEIRLTAERRGGVIRIAVRDNGIGIAPEMLGSVFSPFVQGRRKVDRAEGGLGIGLALAKNLTELHGGTIEAHSEGLGKGSTFVVEVPVRDRPSLHAAPETPRGEQKKRVLVVDDNLDAAELMGELLERAGHTVEIAHDGISALEAYQRLEPEVAILDIGLPVMDGYELASRIRGLEGGSRCRLIAVTGYAQKEDRARTKAAGFQRHLVKPVGLEELEQAIARVTS